MKKINVQNVKEKNFWIKKHKSKFQLNQAVLMNTIISFMEWQMIFQEQWLVMFTLEF